MTAKAKQVEEEFSRALNKSLSEENVAVCRLKVGIVGKISCFPNHFLGKDEEHI